MNNLLSVSVFLILFFGISSCGKNDLDLALEDIRLNLSWNYQQGENFVITNDANVAAHIQIQFGELVDSVKAVVSNNSYNLNSRCNPGATFTCAIGVRLKHSEGTSFITGTSDIPCNSRPQVLYLPKGETLHLKVYGGSSNLRCAEVFAQPVFGPDSENCKVNRLGFMGNYEDECLSSGWDYSTYVRENPPQYSSGCGC